MAGAVGAVTAGRVERVVNGEVLSCACEFGG
jgi:hypothetical protein